MNSEAIKGKRSLKTHLMGLVLVTIFPVLIFAAVLIGFLTFQQLQSVETSLKNTTRALAAAVDIQIVAVKSSLKILSLVEDFDTSNMPDLHRRLSRYVKSQSGWASLALSLPNGKQILNTAMPLGSKLPTWNDYEFFKQLKMTNEPEVSNYRLTPMFKWKVITVAMPVVVNGKLVYVLFGSIYAESFSQLLMNQKLPKDWTASILDLDNTILAQSRNHEKYVGKKASSLLATLTKDSGEEAFRDVNKENQETYAAFSTCHETDWKVVLSLPVSKAKLALWGHFWIILSGGTLLVCIAIFLAFKFGQKIANPILALAQGARALGRGEDFAKVDTSVKEVYDVSEALRLAAEERNEAEKTVQTLYNKAQEAIELRDTFLSVASHELKTPITTLKLQFQILERMIKNAETVSSTSLAKPFQRVLDQTRRLSTLVDDLLDVSRITSGRIQLHPEQVDLSVLLEEIVSHFEGEAEKSGSTISTKIVPGVSGVWDRGRLEQVFINLISNAFKYGNGKPIEVTLDLVDKKAIVRVKDSGIGIASEDLERIFDRFERAVGNRNISGLGLGLWIVKRIIETLNGNIMVESSPQGSVFTVELIITQETV